MSKTRLTRSQEELVANHLRRFGRITPLIAEAEYQNPRLAATINRLRTTHKHLVPEGKTIVSQVKWSAAGVRYTEYTLETNERVTNDVTVRASARGCLLERVAV